MKEEYDVIEIQGKHGEIHLHVPKREPTQEDIDNFYREMAKITLEINRSKKEKHNRSIKSQP